MRFTSFFTSAFAAVLLLGMFSACGSDRYDAPLLTSHIEGVDGDTDLIIAYSLDNNLVNTVYERIQLDSLGNFEFMPELPEGFTDTDVTIYVGDNSVGAFLQKGKTVAVDITVDPVTGALTKTYSGDNTDVSEFINEYNRAFDIMQYFSLDENDTTTNGQYRQLLENNYAAAKEALAGISDSGIRQQYDALSRAQYLGRKAMLISDRAYHEGIPAADDPEYKEVAAEIDPDSETAGRASILHVWLNANNPERSVDGVTDYKAALAELELIDSNISYEPNRRRALGMIANSFFVYNKPTPEEAEGFMEVFSRVAAPYTAMVETYTAKAEEIKKALKAGDPMPYDPELQAPDGSVVRLSDLYGKVLYIDVWATWCGPCQKEIPKFAAAYDRFRNNKGITFLSISVDQDEEAWKAQLKRENPAWPQYRLTPDENKKFSQALAINGIPRFILIGADGKLINPDAPRPSAPDIDSILSQAIAD